LNCTSAEDLILVEIVKVGKTRNWHTILIELVQKHYFTDLDPENKNDRKKLKYRFDTLLHNIRSVKYPKTVGNKEDERIVAVNWEKIQIHLQDI